MVIPLSRIAPAGHLLIVCRGFSWLGHYPADYLGSTPSRRYANITERGALINHVAPGDGFGDSNPTFAGRLCYR